LVKDAGGQALALRVDMRDEEQVAAMVADTLVCFWRHRPADNTVSYNAPEQTGSDGEIHEMDIAIWNRALEIDLRGPTLAAKYCIPEMLSRGRLRRVARKSAAGDRGVGQ
jgi:NAD(P)-dependent dehydrogenase (short-subunit alcohol dehydrogenase family)